jgi:hypothetical protein
VAAENASQLALICPMAAELPPVLADAELAGAEGADELGADDEAGALVDGGAAAEELELLLHAATVAASARPSAGAIIRRAKRFDRMTRLLCLRRMWF